MKCVVKLLFFFNMTVVFLLSKLVVHMTISLQ